MPTNPQPYRTAAFYDAITAFQRTHRLPSLQHAQLRGLLAEHLARVLPVAPTVPSAPADRAALRDRIAALFRTPPGVERLGDATPGEIADAVLAVIPAPTDEMAASLRRDGFGDDEITTLLRPVAVEAPANIRCPDAFWTKQPHAPHDWQQEPDAPPVHCRGRGGEAPQPETQAARPWACAASYSGHCLAEAQSETACDTSAGECVHGSRPAAVSQPGKESTS
ncbi:hypothetical protein ACWCQW_02935 [Streptomyces mirabilis]